jgi:hypothetical protein
MPDKELQQPLVKDLTDLDSTEEHERLIAQRLAAYDAGSSTLKDRAQTGAAAVAHAAPDTAGKMAIPAFPSEHLEIAAFRMMRHRADGTGRLMVHGTAVELS